MFTFTCPKCGAMSLRTVDELKQFKVRERVWRYWCQVCDYDVEFGVGVGGKALAKPVKHKRVREREGG